MNIAICEDDREQREQIRAICTAYFAGEGETCQITEYVNGELLLQNLYQETELLFLDIELGEGKNGIAVMKELEQLRQVRKIVFVSSHHEGVWDSFGWKTLGFVRKPFSRDDIIHWLEVVRHELRQKYILEFHTEKGVRLQEVQQIETIHAEGNYVRVITETDSFFASGGLKYWLGQLREHGIVQVHKSHAVNMAMVAAVHSEVEMKSGKRYPLGRVYRKSVMESYKEFLMQQARRRLG